MRRFLCSATDTCRSKTLAYVQDSFHGLRRQSAADLSVSRPALASVAIPVATTTLQNAPQAGSEFCAFDSRFRDCASSNVAHSDRNRDPGTTATHRLIELDSSPSVGCRDRDVPFDGLRLLVVALGHAHGAVFLAISQRASH